VKMKRRFGISLPRDMVERIDMLSSRLGMSRSFIIQDLISEVIEDRTHLLKPHRCTGILIVVYKSERRESVSKVIERFREPLMTMVHHHVEGTCVDVCIVEGKSELILELESQLRQVKEVGEKYVPLSCVR